MDREIALDNLKAVGFKVKVGEHAFDRHGYLAGQDKDRAADIKAFRADPEVQGVCAMRGGWGAARLLPFLDYDVIARNPKALFGFSDITALHMARTFQNIRLFGGMTVVENILVGAYTRLRQSPVQAVFRTRAFKEEEKAAEVHAERLMEYVGLHGVGNELAASLPYGAQRRVEIAR